MDSKRARFIFLAITLLIISISTVVYAAEKDYPNRPVEIIVTYAPGGSADIAARILQAPLQRALGVPIILTTKAGVGGALGTEYMTKQKPDGYTLALTSNSAVTIGPAINPALPYRWNDLKAICIHLTDPVAIGTKPGYPWKNVHEFIDYAKKNPGVLTYASPGYGSVSFLDLEMMKLALGLDIVAVHFQGSGPAMIATLGGHASIGTGTLSAYVSQLKAGTLILLTHSGGRRVDPYPDVPTMAEIGVKDTLLGWNGFFVSKNTPEAVVEKLSREFEKVLKDPAIKAQLEKGGLNIDYRDGAEALKLMEEEYNTVVKLIKRVGVK